MVDAPHYALEQPVSRSAAALTFAVFLPAACSVFVPLGMMALHANEALAAAREHPVAAGHILLAAVLWTLLFVVPVYRRLKSYGMARSLVIAGDAVVETTHTLFGAVERRMPLSAFRGVVHRVRTSIGGLHHELVLIERQTGRAIPFVVAPLLVREDVDAALGVLGLPELKAADLATLPPLLDSFRIVTAAQPASA